MCPPDEEGSPATVSREEALCLPTAVIDQDPPAETPCDNDRRGDTREKIKPRRAEHVTHIRLAHPNYQGTEELQVPDNPPEISHALDPAQWRVCREPANGQTGLAQFLYEQVTLHRHAAPRRRY